MVSNINLLLSNQYPLYQPSSLVISQIYIVNLPRVIFIPISTLYFEPTITVLGRLPSESTIIYLAV